MKEYQERVIEEKNELDEKINKLYDFIGSDEYNSDITVNQVLLLDQFAIMKSYSNILLRRIEIFQGSSWHPYCRKPTYLTMRD